MRDVAAFGIRRLARPDAAALRAVRLEALRLHPESFGTSADEAARLSVADFAEIAGRPDPDAVFGAFIGPELVGMARFVAETGQKTRHRGTLISVYVRASAGGRGLGEGLVRAVVEHARAHVTVLHVAAVTGNEVARRLYRRLGFEPYGTDRRALRIDGRYLDEELLALMF